MHGQSEMSILEVRTYLLKEHLSIFQEKTNTNCGDTWFHIALLFMHAVIQIIIKVLK